MTQLVCRECGRTRTPRHSLCHTCYSRANPYHQPTGVGRGAPGLPKSAGDIAGRIEDFVWLRQEQGYTTYDAARRIGISYRTALRYLSRLRVPDG